ncbi:hypothetical protein BH09BAC1_BH09BAC1_04100 [soil metagenome]
MTRVNNNTQLMLDLTDLLQDFSFSTQKQFEILSGKIESAYRDGLLDVEDYEQLQKRERFEMYYEELVERNCMDLSMRMIGYLDTLRKKMEEYDSVSF